MSGAARPADLQQSAHLALVQFGIRGALLRCIASRHNDVFSVDTVSGERFVLRLQKDQMSDAKARSQLTWLKALATLPDVAVPAPVSTIEGFPFAHIETRRGRRRAVLLKWVPGRISRKRDDASFRVAARMIAKMHTHAQTYRPPRGFSCPRLDGDWMFGARFFVRDARAPKHVNASQRKVAASAEKFVRDAMDRLGEHKSRFGVIHADLNLDNILFHRGRPSPIDFDEFGKGWYVYDLAELIRTSITTDNWKARKQLVLEAYLGSRRLDDAEIESFDAFIVATFVQYLNWAFIHARNAYDLRWVEYCLRVVQQLTIPRP